MSFRNELVEFEIRLQRELPDIYCPIHLCLGTEHVAEALHECLRPEDWLFSYHRAHGHYKAKGGDMDALYDEIMGKSTGINGGFSGSQEFSDPARNFHCSAIVGGLVGVATGTALGLQLRGVDAVVVCMIGDAGTEQGVFWESINFAALHRLPIAYICENNGLSVDSEIKDRQAMPIIPRIEAFGINIERSVQKAIARARLGIPSFYEAHVTRRCAHINMATMTEL